MAEVVARIATALIALVVVAALAVELRGHDLLENAGHVAVQLHPQRAAVDRNLHDLKTVIDIRPGADGYLATAALDLRTGRYAAAKRAALRSTQREPQNFGAWVTLAVAAAQTGDKLGSQVAYAKAHLLNPLYPIPH